MLDDTKVTMEYCNGEKHLPYDEENIPLKGQGKFHNILQLGCGLCLISMISEVLNTAYLLPSAECDFQMTSSDKGMLSAICYLGMIASSHLWGFMADTKGRKFTLVLTLLLDGICALASSFAHSYWLFLLLRFFNGFFICGPSAVVYAYMGEFHSNATRSRAIMWGAVFISGAIMALPGIAWTIISQQWSFQLPLYIYHSWRLFVVICSLPSFLSAALFLVYLPESPKFLLSQDREEEALQVLQYMFTQNTGCNPKHYKVKSLVREDMSSGESNQKHKQSVSRVLKLMWDQTQPLFVAPHLWKTLLGCCLMFGIYASFNGLLLWLPEIFNRLAEYEEIYPGVSATVCDVFSTLAGNSTSNSNHTSNIIVNEIVLSSTATILADHLVSGAIRDEVLSTISTVQSLPALNKTLICSATVAPIVFKKSLIIGGSSALANIACVFLIGYVGKKNILVTCLLLSGVCGGALLTVKSAAGVLILSSILEALTMTSPTVLNSILIDIFPTHLRAMAVCVSMLMGRVGTVSSSIIMGFLLEVNCTLVFVALGGVLLVCGSLAYLLPSSGD
ncbi:hypothetical protein C0J52_16409 [Blattella germanica]|nr:hypothetical protein C0J52_16409 [Blattella germanica]